MCFPKTQNRPATRPAPPQGGIPPQARNRPAPPPARRRLPDAAQQMNGAPPHRAPCQQQQQRFRVRVRFHQNHGHPIGGANVVIDNAPAVQTNAQGLTDWKVKAGDGRHRIRVTAPAPNNGLYVECRCQPCTQGTPLRYWPWNDQEYIAGQINGADQTVDVYVDQVVRVKVGYPDEDSVPGPNTVDRTWVIFYLPETKGAAQNQGSGFWTWLGMTTNRGIVDYFGTDPAGAAVQQGGAFDFVLGAKAAGWHFARVVGGGAGPARVSVRLVEEAYAREDPAYNAAPLIPWTFYFWPTGTGANTTSRQPRADRDVFSPLWAFDVWAGRNPTAANSAFGWESNPANAHHDTEGDWSGHCNQAATASIIFKEPPANIDWRWKDAARGNRQLSLDSEGLKVLATEFAGHRVRTETLFTIFPAMIPEGAGLGEQAKLIRELNGLIPDRVPRKFPERGTYAARIFSAMQTELGENGQPLLTDVRAPAGGGAAAMNQVWNQAIYLYRAYYREHPQALQTDAEERRAQDMQVNLTVFWNEDYQPTYGPDKATAAVVDRGGGVFTVTPRDIDGRGLSLWRQMLLRLQFSSGGRLNAADARNNIETSTGLNNSPFYLLRYLQRITQVTANTVSTDGNPFVDDTLFNLKQPEGTQVVQLRRRYPIT